jgi:hypothetical protein
MKIAPEHLAAIQGYGYTPTEAAFLYLVATHSGYFTQRQFLHFARVKTGGAVNRLTQKILHLQHGRRARYGCCTFIYNLYSRLIYDFIDKDNLRNRSRLSNDLIRTRLLILDFVLSHLDHKYLETEAEKIAYFQHELSVPLLVLPGRSYPGIQSDSNTKRYFADRFPIFVPCGLDSGSVPQVPTFVYCDSPEPRLLGYSSYLRMYQGLLNSLPAFNLIYAGANQAKFKRAGKLFARLFGGEDGLDVDRLVRYFEIRQLWESHKTSFLTRADRQVLRDGDQRFHSQLLQNAYRIWTTKPSEPGLQDLLRRAKAQQSRQFSTCVLPHRYNIFERVSKTISRKSREPFLEVHAPEVVHLSASPLCSPPHGSWSDIE